MENSQIQNINELPDELLLKILSSLPTRSVVATSILSKRWQSLWKQMKIYSYNGTSQNIRFKRFALFISRRSNVETLQLKLHPAFKSSDIKFWVNIAVSRSLKEFRLELVYNPFELPKSFFMKSHLETVILEKLSLVDIPSDASLICLKRLHLLSVRFSSDESVKMLLSRCPVLEDLVVRRSSYTNVRIFVIDVVTLKSLSIDNSCGKSWPDGVHGFVINAPSLRCFSIKDKFSNYLRFEDMPELVKASVNVVCDQPQEFLGSLASTRYLSLCSVTSPSGTSFVFLDHLELCLCSAEWWNLLNLILNAAPRLRVLKLNLYWKHCVQYNSEMISWNQPDSVPECLSSHLEIFEWRQYKGTEHEREAAKYILTNGSCLEKATFYHSDSEEKHEMWKELECVARGSKTCQLVFE